MRIVNATDIADAIARMSYEACVRLPDDTRRALETAYETEISPTAKACLHQLLENVRIARAHDMPLCQDTGMCCVFIDIGNDVHIGGDLTAAVNDGIRRGYLGLRKSVLHPITRENTGDNTPAILHTRIVPGDKIGITVAPKGFGSENMSSAAMLTPSQGVGGIKRFVVDTVRRAGANPCPPVVVGVGIGGTFEYAALISKRALLRELGTPSEDKYAVELEKELLAEINALGIGAQGLGGAVTALAVHIEVFPTHIAGLPVAVNMQCNSARHAKITL